MRTQSYPGSSLEKSIVPFDECCLDTNPISKVAVSAEHFGYESNVISCGCIPVAGIIRSYLAESTGSHPNSEVKQLWACTVLRWGTTRESQVTHVFDSDIPDDAVSIPPMLGSIPRRFASTMGATEGFDPGHQ